MSERAHPDDPGFRSNWTFRLRRGFIPWFFRNYYRREFFWRYRWANRHCRGRKVLDVPCGVGWGTSLIHSATERVGADISPEVVEEANQRFGDHCRFVAASMERLPFPDQDFDAVCCLEGIEHVPPEIGLHFITECARLLRDEGVLLLSSPHCVDGRHSGNPFHIKEYTKAELVNLVSPHFTVQDVVTRRFERMEIVYLSATKLPTAGHAT